MESPEELKAKLDLYYEQLDQVRTALRLTPEDDSLKKLENDLAEVILLTEDLYRFSLENATEIPTESSSSLEATTFDAPVIFPVGTRVKAKYTGDDEWHTATVKAVLVDNRYLVHYTQYGGQEILENSSVKAHDGDESSDILRKRAVEEFPSSTSAASRSEEEQVQAPKRPKVDSGKSKGKLKKVEEDRNQKQAAWDAFKKKPAVKVKSGFLAGLGRKKESIFKSPEGAGGRVGVTGSGKPMTENPNAKRERYRL